LRTDFEVRAMRMESVATDRGSPAAGPGDAGRRAGHEKATGLRPRLEVSEVSAELLAIVGYVTAVDGPLQSEPDAAPRPSPWHKPVLLKAMERLEVIGDCLRGRIAFLVAGRDHGYYSSAQELELAGEALDNCRATTLVVKALLAGLLPTRREFDSMGETALAIYPALEAITLTR
jgi:hypothetical protein